jgi:hypothetical protein
MSVANEAGTKYELRIPSNPLTIIAAKKVLLLGQVSMNAALPLPA